MYVFSPAPATLLVYSTFSTRSLHLHFYVLPMEVYCCYTAVAVPCARAPYLSSATATKITYADLI